MRGEKRMNKYKIESDFIYKGYRCITIFNSLGIRCGYVGIPKGHCLYGKEDYDKVGVMVKEWAEEMNIDKLSPVTLFLGNLQDTESEIRMDMFFNVHGSITYTNGGENSSYPIKSDLWWIGFDCGHAEDGRDLDFVEELWGDDEELKRWVIFERTTQCFEDWEIRTLEYTQQECKNLVDQVIHYVKKFDNK